jgi:glycosyltransferase involved in cell wall biosynthesis
LPGPPDIALVSLGTTPGLVRSDESFAELVRAAGCTVEIRRVPIGRAAGKLRRGAAAVDLIEALAAARVRTADARAVVFSTTTAALLARPRRPYAIRFDATAAINRPGPGGAWQRAAERRALRGAAVLLPVSSGAAAAAGGVKLPIPIEPIAGAAERDIDAITYACDPRKRGLERVCRAWADRHGRFVIGGIGRDSGLRWLERHRVPEPVGAEWAGPLPRERWLEHVGRARLFVNGSRWEDFGIAPMEALSAGTPLATVPTPGSFEALPLARELAPELVSDDLRAAIDAGMRVDRERYARRAAELLAPYRPEAVLARLRDEVLPRLLP